MTLAIRTRAAVVTTELTYKGHYFEFEEHADGNVAKLLAPDQSTVLALTDARYTSADGTVYYVIGRNTEGVEVKWRAVKACARCSTPGVYETPAYDRPV